MSGGVDSSVAAKLLLEKGYTVEGVLMNVGQVNYKEDKKRVGEVAQKLGIPFRIVNLKKEFKKEVIDYFLKEYAAGRTPNPCVVCNKKIKLNLLLRYAQGKGFRYLATGHYIKLKAYKVSGDKGFKYRLFIAKDKKKDQSYFLYNLKQSQLKRLLFPLGNYLKEEVIKMAARWDLPHHQKQSQDICFLAGIDHNVFLKKHLSLKKGPIITTEGETVGEHEGLPLYTIGQRRGIKIGGIGPFYVVKTDYKNNALIVTKKFDDRILYSNLLLAKEVNWISGEKPPLPFSCRARIRYGHPLEECRIDFQKGKYVVKFKKPQRAITPGQSVVFYKRNELLGGGVIM